MVAMASSFSNLTNTPNELSCDCSTDSFVMNSFFMIPAFYLICKKYDCGEQACEVNQACSLSQTARERH